MPISPARVVAAAAALWFVTILALSILRQESGHSQSFDLALYARSLWGIAHGFPLNPMRDAHALGIHFHLILYPLIPFARLADPATVLITAQTAALACGAVALYSVGIARLERPWLAVVVALAWLLHPAVVNAALFDVHPKTIAAPFWILAIDRLDRRGVQDLKAWLCLLIAFSCREEIAVLTAIVGLAMATRPSQRRVGALLVVVGGSYAALYFGILAPHWGRDMGSAEAHFGGLDAAAALSRLLEVDSGLLVIGLLAPFAFLSLADWRLATAAALPILLACVSNVPSASTLQSHYPFLAVPPLALAAVVGLARFERSRPRWLRGIAIAALTLSAITYVGAAQAPGGVRFDSRQYAFDPDAIDAARCAEHVPPDAPIMADFHLASWFAARPTIFVRIDHETVAKLGWILVAVEPPSWIVDTPYNRAIFERHARQVAQLVGGFGFTLQEQCGKYVLLYRPTTAAPMSADGVGAR